MMPCWIWKMVIITILAAGISTAQDQAGVSEEVLGGDAFSQEKAPVSPPPGEEVMRPTSKGFRFTPGLANAFGRFFVTEELEEKYSLDAEQKRQLSQALGRRCWDLYVRRGHEGALALQQLYEGLLVHEAGHQPLDADSARRFAENVGPGLPIIHEFFEGLYEDARPILSDEQFQRLESEMEEERDELRRFEKTLERWRRGEVREGEDLEDALENRTPEGQESKPKSEAYERAERSARWQIEQLGPNEWRRFLRRAENVLGFDDAQRAAGKKLLDGYREEAEPIMTDEWKEKAKSVQIRMNARWQFGNEPLDPWLFRLEQEYNQLARPIKDLGKSFRRDVLALATLEQRDKLLAGVQKVAIEHGMTAEESAVSFILPEPGPTTRPQTEFDHAAYSQ